MKKPILFCFAIASLACKSYSQNLNLTLAAHRSYGSESLSNICGWVDTADGKEYALVGAENGLSIVDVSIPSTPVIIIQIPGPPSTWREIKTWGDYAYVTTEDGAIGLQIVELTNLPATNLAVTTWKPLIGVDSLETIHALHIDNGKAYLYGSNVANQGAIIADIATNPMAPVYLGSYDLKYIHEKGIAHREAKLALARKIAGLSLALLKNNDTFKNNFETQEQEKAIIRKEIYLGKTI